ncbi:unnamed protein product [Cunninghamella blakesleeana]
MSVTTSSSPTSINILIDNASKELSEQYQVNHLAEDSINQVKEYQTQCYSRINDTDTQITETQKETQSIRDKLVDLEQQFNSLEQSFNTIDQLENMIHQMNIALNQVSHNVEEMEKSIANSIQPKLSVSIPFLMSKRSDPLPYQPYFPPPQHVDIPSFK